MFAFNILNEVLGNNHQFTEHIKAKVVKYKQRITRSAPVKYVVLETQFGRMTYRKPSNTNLSDGSDVLVHIKTGYFGFKYIDKVENS